MYLLIKGQFRGEQHDSQNVRSLKNEINMKKSTYHNDIMMMNTFIDKHKIVIDKSPL